MKSAGKEKKGRETADKQQPNYHKTFQQIAEFCRRPESSTEIFLSE